MISSLKIPFTAHFTSVYLSPLASHKTALSDCCLCAALSLPESPLLEPLLPHPVWPTQWECSRDEAGPVDGLQGLPNPWNVMRTIVCGQLSREGVILWFKYPWADPLNVKGFWFRSLIWNSSKKKNLLFPRPNTKLGIQLVLNKKK